MRAFLLGMLASFFFAVTFVLNRLMSDGGGSWIWSASLRYLFMLPLLLVIVVARRKLVALFKEMRKHPWRWAWWSFIGFGCFYAPLCLAAAYSPAWLVAGAWQFTIIAGSLLVPLFHERIQTVQGVAYVRKRIPFGSMGMSFIILLGIFIMEWSEAHTVSVRDMLLGIVPIALAAFAYPLGNRKMMDLCEGSLDAYQRTLGMTMASLPLWVILSAYQFVRHGSPSGEQIIQSWIVALFSGVIATVLFFTATDMARNNMNQLAAVEATQSGEVVFTVIGELLIIPGTKISIAGLIGLCLVVVGMILHSWTSSRRKNRHRSATDGVQATT